MNLLKDEPFYKRVRTIAINDKRLKNGHGCRSDERLQYGWQGNLIISVTHNTLIIKILSNGLLPEHNKTLGTAYHL